MTLADELRAEGDAISSAWKSAEGDAIRWRLHKAADEIERLNAQVEALTKEGCAHEFDVIDIGGGYIRETKARCRKCGFEPGPGWAATGPTTAAIREALEETK